MDLKSLFTTDEEMEDLEDRDMTTSIVGYVDAITAPAPAGKNNDPLFKFILSNSSKRIAILVWGNTLINKFYKDVCSTRVVSINGGHCRAVSQTKFKEDNNLIPFEVIIKENTKVSFLGYYGLGSQMANVLQKATFDNIHTMEGLVEISGYIRTPFSLIHNRSGLMTYGLGAITDGSKKLTVQIKQFAECKLEIGDYITVTGTVTGQDFLVTVFCNSMNDVKFDPDVQALPPEKVQRGGRPVKRIRPVEKKVL